MTKSKIARAAALAALTMSGLAAPIPARASIEELRECLHNCYIAYVVETQQPAFLQQCNTHCFQLYGGTGFTSTTYTAVAVIRYS